MQTAGPEVHLLLQEIDQLHLDELQGVNNIQKLHALNFALDRQLVESALEKLRLQRSAHREQAASAQVAKNRREAEEREADVAEARKLNAEALAEAAEQRRRDANAATQEAQEAAESAEAARTQKLFWDKTLAPKRERKSDRWGNSRTTWWTGSGSRPLHRQPYLYHGTKV